MRHLIFVIALAACSAEATVIVAAPDAGGMCAPHTYPPATVAAVGFCSNRSGSRGTEVEYELRLDLGDVVVTIDLGGITEPGDYEVEGGGELHLDELSPSGVSGWVAGVSVTDGAGCPALVEYAAFDGAVVIRDGGRGSACRDLLEEPECPPAGGNGHRRCH